MSPRLTGVLLALFLLSACMPSGMQQNFEAVLPVDGKIVFRS